MIMRKQFPVLPLFLFFITVLTTLVAGALQRGEDVFHNPGRLIAGIPFSGALMVILLSHELAHYVVAKRHAVEVTLPFFMPAPTFIGTFGAFIKMKSMIRSREALVDIGASGPLAGFLVSLVVSVIGLRYSHVAELSRVSEILSLGDSLLFSWLVRMSMGTVPAGSDVVLHPAAFAGWIGFFITSVNLIPVGQLDGGHIAYALLGKKQKYLSISLTAMLVFLGVFVWFGWLLWAVILMVLGFRHPPMHEPEIRLDPKRRCISSVCLIIFLITFTPAPFVIETPFFP
ncbi:MAG: site-2 protease family protein [bacterium]